VLAEGGGRAALGGRTSRTRARVAAADGDKAALPPRYSFLVLFQQRFVDVDLDSCYDRRLEDGGEREGRASTWGCEADDVERGFLRRVTGVGL
jgi:hypothetical protein